LVFLRNRSTISPHLHPAVVWHSGMGQVMGANPNVC
jgi:hypothetical protein